ncbi:MAG: hypothetical protein HOV80_09960 [Polyangiaceae bacterium]|nr:hypothetical protein [Polyangiaceae bacterium]
MGISPDGPQTTSRLAKHLEGWQLGVVIVVMAWVAVLLMVPRTEEPESVPLPHLAPREVSASRARAAEESRRLASHELSPNLRLLGARLNAYGLAEHAGDKRRMVELAQLTQELGGQLAVLEHEHILDLRAHLAERFVQTFSEFVRTGIETEELVGLGGNVVETFRKNGWLEHTDEPEFDLFLRGLHKRRFDKLIGTKIEMPIDSAEERAKVRFLMQHPPRAPVADPDGVFAGNFVLGQIEEAVNLDPSYPENYARGIALFRIGRYEASAAAFDAFLAERDGGPYRIRAANYLKAAVEYAGSE